MQIADILTDHIFINISDNHIKLLGPVVREAFSLNGWQVHNEKQNWLFIEQLN